MKYYQLQYKKSRLSLAVTIMFALMIALSCGGGGVGSDPITHRVSANAGTGDEISQSSRSVTHGATATFTVTPDSGYRIATVTGCASSLLGNIRNPLTDKHRVATDIFTQGR